MIKCVDCGSVLDFDRIHNDVTCKNKNCVLFEEAIDIRDYVDDLVEYEKSTKDFLNKQIEAWKNKYKILLESKIKSLDK